MLVRVMIQISRIPNRIKEALQGGNQARVRKSNIRRQRREAFIQKERKWGCLLLKVTLSLGSEEKAPGQSTGQKALVREGMGSITARKIKQFGSW